MPVARSATLSLLCALLAAAGAQAAQPLFDTHLHYDADDAARYSPADILAILDRQDVRRAVVTAMPAKNALALYRQAPERVLPLLGAYRIPEDKQAWTQDSTLPARLATELEEDDWRGIGELHLFAGQRHSPVFAQVVALAEKHRLPLLVHCDPVVIDTLFELAPRATVIWAHAGAYPYPPLLADYLARYPNLYVDLSVRDERIAPRGSLDADWELLLLEHSERFTVGVDTYRTARWGNYGRVIANTRQWLGQLPPSVAAAIAHDNAARIFAASVSPRR